MAANSTPTPNTTPTKENKPVFKETTDAKILAMVARKQELDERVYQSFLLVFDSFEAKFSGNQKLDKNDLDRVVPGVLDFRKNVDQHYKAKKPYKTFDEIFKDFSDEMVFLRGFYSNIEKFTKVAVSPAMKSALATILKKIETAMELHKKWTSAFVDYIVTLAKKSDSLKVAKATSALNIVSEKVLSQDANKTESSAWKKVGSILLKTVLILGSLGLIAGGAAAAGKVYWEAEGREKYENWESQRRYEKNKEAYKRAARDAASTVMEDPSVLVPNFLKGKE